MKIHGAYGAYAGNIYIYMHYPEKRTRRDHINEVTLHGSWKGGDER